MRDEKHKRPFHASRDAAFDELRELQPFATGTGATGWARSQPTDGCLVSFVREAFPSRATGTDCTAGLLPQGKSLEVWSEMDDGGMLFGDGIECDRLEFAWASAPCSAEPTGACGWCGESWPVGVAPRAFQVHARHERSCLWLLQCETGAHRR